MRTGVRLGVDPGWIESRTGVRERRLVSDEETLVDLAERASRDALAAAGVEPGAIEAIPGPAANEPPSGLRSGGLLSSAAIR